VLKWSNQCEVKKCLLVETDVQVRKVKFLGVHFADADLSKLLLETGQVEMPHTLGDRLVMLVSETERLLPVSPVSALFLQGTVASEGLDCQVLIISSDWLIG